MAPNLFYGTSIPACILLLRKQRPDEHRDHVLIINAEEIFTKGRAQNTLSNAQADQIYQTYLEQYQQGPSAKVLEGVASKAPEMRAHILSKRAMIDVDAIKEVLDTMISLAEDGMTMLCVTHEMGFARSVADRVIFMADGRIVEQAPPQTFFANPEHPQLRAFLGQILSSNGQAAHA